MEEDLKKIWTDVLGIIKDEINSPVSYKTWFESITPIRITKDEIIITVPNPMARDMINTRYLDLTRNALAHVTKRSLNIKIYVGKAPDEENVTEETKKADSSVNNVFRSGELTSEKTLNPKYTFDSFVIGHSNSFAHAACLAVAESPSDQYNPLFIYGGVGLGKTHLMHAIGHHILQNNKNARVVYVSSERFMNEMIHSIQNNSNEAFREKYRRNVDVIMIDDIQFIAGKESTQQELFHTFNELKESNKQIIISSDRPPNEIPTLEDRLRTRFSSGLLADIQQPDFETRVAILKKKSEAENYIVPDEVLIYIATKIKTNIRDLEGALTRVIAYSTLSNNPLTVDLAIETLKDIISDTSSKEISVTLIQDVVANYYNISVDDLKSSRRTRNVALPRQIAMYLARNLTSVSLPKIGEEFNKDHTTVMHAHSKIKDLMKKEDNLRKIVESITKKLTS